MRVAGTCSSSASLFTLKPSGFMKSSRRISPGCTGGINCSVFSIFIPHTLRVSGFVLANPELRVIIDDFHVVTMPVAPNETNPPLLVDPYGVLPLPVTSQGFQLIPSRRRTDAQFRGGTQFHKLPRRDPPQPR